MAASRTRPGNPDRGWNDPPMFNFDPGQTGGQPRRNLNKRVAFPMSGTTGGLPGVAVMNPGQGPPMINPVLPADIQPPPPVAQQPPMPIGLKDTPLGDPAPPTSPVQLLPPTADASAPQPVPVLVPTLIPSLPHTQGTSTLDIQPAAGTQLQDERLDELMARLSISSDEILLEFALQKYDSVLESYKHILTLKVMEETRKKFEVLKERWQKSGFTEVVKVRIVKLAEALEKGETEKANHLHLALVVDHIAEVNQWIMGVKRLLQQQQLANKEREIIEENRQSANQENLGETTECGSAKSGEITSSEVTLESTVNDNSNSGEVTGDTETAKECCDKGGDNAEVENDSQTASLDSKDIKQEAEAEAGKDVNETGDS